MHAAALDWVRRYAPSEPVRVLDVGGRDINGNPDHLFHSQSTFEAIDLIDGPRVTWVGDVLDFGDPDPFDVALYLEVAEHTAEWPEHVAHIRRLLDHREGMLIFTAAGPGRAPHSAIDGEQVRPDEHYRNIVPDDLAWVLDRHFSRFVVDVCGPDVRAAAWR